MKTIEINEVTKYIELSPIEMNLMFVGDTGIGKTTVIENYCKEKNIFLKTLILSQLEASETLGVPVKSTKEYNGQTYDTLTSAIPEWVFELAEHKNAMLFLDEFLCAQPSVMNAFLNFLTQKKVQNIDLSHVKIVAATNIGNYTFDPDNNILSRFCWFYAVNTSVNEFVKDDRIVNNYQDENEKEGVIFEIRSLKPRCHEQLSKIDTEYLQDFYEGFTNKKYIIVNLDKDVNEVIAPYFTCESFNVYSITDENLTNMCAIMKSKFNRVRKWDKILASFVNLDIKIISKIKDLILEGE